MTSCRRGGDVRGRNNSDRAGAHGDGLAVAEQVVRQAWTRRECREGPARPSPAAELVIDLVHVMTDGCKFRGIVEGESNQKVFILTLICCQQRDTAIQWLAAYFRPTSASQCSAH
jgi:hypothetical protein